MKETRSFAQTQERWKRIIEHDVFKHNLEIVRQDKGKISWAVADTRKKLNLSPYWEMFFLPLSFELGYPIPKIRPAGALYFKPLLDPKTGKIIYPAFIFPETTKRDVLSFYKRFCKVKREIGKEEIHHQGNLPLIKAGKDIITHNYYFQVIPTSKTTRKSMLEAYSNISKYYEACGQKVVKRKSSRHEEEYLAKMLSEEKYTYSYIAKIINQKRSKDNRIGVENVSSLIRGAKRKQKKL